MVKTIHYSKPGNNFIHCTGKAPENWSLIRFTTDKADVTCPDCLVAQLKDYTVCPECKFNNVNEHGQLCMACSEKVAT